jgi:hypothetical protein
LDDRQKLVTEIKQWPPLPVHLYDPYKCLLYQIVAQMEELPQGPPTDNISPTFEDFMWLHVIIIFKNFHKLYLAPLLLYPLPYPLYFIANVCS